MSNSSLVIDTYSDLADTYDGTANARSCWGTDTERIIKLLQPRPQDRVVADIGAGAGGALLDMSRRMPADTRFIGVEPAANLRVRAKALTEAQGNIEILEGAFENIPLPDASVDYMTSINAFHWCAKPKEGVAEMRRVLRPDGAMDHFFIGRNMGREFIRATTPIFMKYMGAKALLEATVMRQHLTVETARDLFAPQFGDRIDISEEYTTYYDTVEGHLGWWVRIAPQLVYIPEEKRGAFNEDIRKALGGIAVEQGVPYTMHTIRAHLR